MAEFARRNLGCFVCSHVFENARPVLLGVHWEGDWQFMCGAVDHGADGRYVGVGHLIDRDPSLNECADLPDGFEAERSAVGQPWRHSRIPYRPADTKPGTLKGSSPVRPLVSAAVEGSTSPPDDDMARSKPFEDLVEAATDYLKDRQARLEQEYSLGKWPRYDWSQGTRQLVFSDGGKPKVVADIQFVGSVSTRSDTWLWAWANDTVTPDLHEAVLKVRQHGAVHGLPHLTTAKWRATEVDGWEMTSIAAFLLLAEGAYRSPDGNGFTFMIVTAVGWAT
jgi:hypothetical protein